VTGWALNPVRFRCIGHHEESILKETVQLDKTDCGARKSREDCYHLDKPKAFKGSYAPLKALL
jgi:hypothetical protein